MLPVSPARIAAVQSSMRCRPHTLLRAQAALRLALHSPWARERAAAEHVLRSFCSANPDGQLALASTLAPIAHGSRWGLWAKSYMRGAGWKGWVVCAQDMKGTVAH